MKKSMKIGIFVTMGLILLGYAYYVFRGAMEVEAKTLNLTLAEVTLTEKGLVKNTGERYIYPMVMGEIQSINVKKGQTVKKGEVLATLVSREQEAQVESMRKGLEAIRAQLATAELTDESNRKALLLNIKNLKGQLQALEAEANTEAQRETDMLLAKQVFERGEKNLASSKALYEQGLLSEADYLDQKVLVDTYKSNYDKSVMAQNSGKNYYEGMRNSLNAQMESIHVTLNSQMLPLTRAYYQALIEQSEASLDGVVAHLSNYTLRMPEDGVIREVFIENSNQVTGQSPAFFIQMDGKQSIETKVNLRDLENITVGAPVTLVLDRRSGNLELSGTITDVAKNAIAEISPLGIEVRKVLVTIEPETNEVLFSGYEVDVKFSLFKEEERMVVPNSAFFKKEGKDYVLLIKNGQVTEVPVVLGFELRGETIVKEGLADGDVLITDLDAKGLKVGKKVIPSDD